MGKNDWRYTGGGISDAEKVAEARKNESEAKKRKRKDLKTRGMTGSERLEMGGMGVGMR